MNSTFGNRRWATKFLLLLLVVALTAVGLLMTWVFPLTKNSAPTAVTPLALWQSHELTGYRYTLQVSCFCMREVTREVVIEVRQGAIASATYVDDGTAADTALFDLYAPAEKLFTIIADAQAQNPAKLDVVYDQTYGIPLSVDIDISEMMADEELQVQITAFQPIP